MVIPKFEQPWTLWTFQREKYVDLYNALINSK